MHRTAPCGYQRITAALWPRGRGCVDRDTVRSIMRSQGLEAAQPHRKVRTTVPAAGPGARAPTWSSATPTASEPGMKRVGDITYVRTWEGLVYLATVPGCCTRKAVGYAMVGSTRHRARCARPSTWRLAGARRGERRRSSTPGRGTPVHLRSAHRPPGRLRRSPSKREGPRRAGRVPGRKSAGATLENERAHADGVPHEKQDHPGYCFPGRVGLQSESAPLRPGAQDNRTSSLKHSFQGYPRHARQSKFINAAFSAAKRDAETTTDE